MKKFAIAFLLFVNVFIITIYVNLYREYVKTNELLLNKLDGISYYEYIKKVEKEKEDIINNISVKLGYNLEDVNTFDGIRNELNNELKELDLKKMQLINKKDGLKKQDNNLRITYNKLLDEERKKSTYIINGVPKINQYSLGYPTGCESAALTGLLRFWGVSVNMSDIVDKLVKGKLPYYENGIRYGGNPYLEFVGHPSTYSSYGVYEKPIINLANYFKPGIINGTGMKLSDVLNVVKEGRPVVVWVSMNMAVPYISTSWIYKPTGEKISWMANEHALIVIGYSQNQVIVSDSLNGGIRYYNKAVFESRYNTYGKRAIYY